MTADPNGLDVIDMAAAIFTHAMRTATRVSLARRTDPTACPDYGPDLSPPAIAFRAVGEFLKAGLLVTPATPAEVEAIRRRAGGGT